MPIYFRNTPAKEPFTFESIGNHWRQDRVSRPEGYPLYHYLQTETGRGRFEIQGQTYTLREGQGILVAPFIPHSYAGQGDEWYTSFATVSGSISGSIGGMLKNRPYILIDREQGTAISQIIAEGIGHFTHAPTDTSLLSLCCYRFLLQFVEGAAPGNFSESPLYQLYVGPVIKEIETNYHSRLTVQELSRQVYVTPQYLTRLFRRFLGCSTYEYLTACRLNRAKEFLLSRPHLDIQDIAGLVGFDNSSHFIAAFKRHTGMTPLGFRTLYKFRE